MKERMASRDPKDDPSGRLPDFKARSHSQALEAIVPWRLAQPEKGESCRWQCVDTRWVSVSLGADDELGSVVVKDSGGQRQVVQSYEGALALAKAWRTW